MIKSIVVTWKWLWGLPVELNVKVAVKLAKESFRSLEKSVEELTERVSKVVNAYQLAKDKYDDKQQEEMIELLDADLEISSDILFVIKNFGVDLTKSEKELLIKEVKQFISLKKYYKY